MWSEESNARSGKGGKGHKSLRTLQKSERPKASRLILRSIRAVGVRRDVQGLGEEFDESQRRRVQDRDDRYRVAEPRERLRYGRSRSREHREARELRYQDNRDIILARPEPERGGYHDGSGRDQRTWRDDGHMQEWGSARWDDRRRRPESRSQSRGRRSGEANREPAWATSPQSRNHYQLRPVHSRGTSNNVETLQ